MTKRGQNIKTSIKCIDMHIPETSHIPISATRGYYGEARPILVRYEHPFTEDSLQERVHIRLSQRFYPPSKTKLHPDYASIRHGFETRSSFRRSIFFRYRRRAIQKTCFRKAVADRLSKTCFLRMTLELAIGRLRFVLGRFGRSF
jgi:hypothetical protein